MTDISFAQRDESVVRDVAPVPEPQTVLFTGDNGAFRRLVTRGALLEIVTAGFYRFWLATQMRRYLWSSTIIGGDALEYVGAARELLFGFFFSLIVLAPAYFVYFLVTVEAERQEAFASLPLLLFFVAFGQYANYGARRYRLHKTSWRGLRFGMGGSGLAYMARAMGWGVVIALTLGLALPWAQASLERYKMSNTFYGELRGRFVGRGGEFFKKAWWIWAVTIITIIGSAALGIAAADGRGGPLAVLASLALMLGAPSLYAAYKTAQWRWWLAGLRLGDIRVETRLGTRAFLGNFYIYFGLVGAVLIVFVFIALLMASAFFKHGLPQPSATVVGLWIAFYVATMVVIGIATRIYFVQRVWKIVASSLLVHALHAADDVAAGANASASAINESFVDNLDVVGF